MLTVLNCHYTPDDTASLPNDVSQSYALGTISMQLLWTHFSTFVDKSVLTLPYQFIIPPGTPSRMLNNISCSHLD